MARRPPGHEAEAKFQKTTQQHQIRPTFSRLGTRQGRGVKQPELSRRKAGYGHAIDEFVDWYCSEPRLAFNRIVVLRYRCHLESRQLAPGTINLRLGAVRRLAYEAADCGLLSADLVAGVRRVKGVKKLAMRLGLVNGRARPCVVASPRSSSPERKTRPSLARTATRVWVEEAGSCDFDNGSSSAARRTLGHR